MYFFLKTVIIFPIWRVKLYVCVCVCGYLKLGFVVKNPWCDSVANSLVRGASPRKKEWGTRRRSGKAWRQTQKDSWQGWPTLCSRKWVWMSSARIYVPGTGHLPWDCPSWGKEESYVFSSLLLSFRPKLSSPEHQCTCVSDLHFWTSHGVSGTCTHWWTIAKWILQGWTEASCLAVE